MRSFPRFFVAILILVGLFLALAPYFAGEIAQQQFNNQLQTLNEQSPYITITPSNYQRHWFNSTAQLLIDIHSPKGSMAQFDKKITVDAIIKHGPLIKVNGGFYFAKGALIIESNTPDFEGALVYIVNWRNQLISSANIPFLKFTDSAGNMYTAQSVQFETALNNHHVVHTLILRNICIVTANKNPVSLDLYNIMITSNKHQSNNLWLGNAEVFIGSGVLLNHTTQANIVSIDKLTLNALGSLSQDQTKLNSLFNLHVQSATFMTKTIEPITLNYGVQDVDINSYKNFMNILEQSKNTSINANPAQDMALLQSLAQVVESGLCISINRFYIGLPKTIASSPVDIHADIAFTPMDKLAAQGLTATSAAGFMGMAPMLATTLVKTMHATATLSLPQDLVKEGLALHYATLLANSGMKQKPPVQTPEALGDAAYNYLVTNHMFVPNTDGSLKIMIVFDKTGALINGQKPALQLPIPTMIPGGHLAQ